jgi:hypothetical protein
VRLRDCFDLTRWRHEHTVTIADWPTRTVFSSSRGLYTSPEKRSDFK